MPHIAGKIRRKHAVEVDDLPELRGCGCKQVSIETAQSKLDCSVLAHSTTSRSWSAASTCRT